MDKYPTLIRPAWKKGKDALFIDHYRYIGTQYLDGQITYEQVRKDAKSYRKLEQQIADKDERTQFILDYLDRLQELKAQVGFRTSRP